jgi:hypothetical protein
MRIVVDGVCFVRRSCLIFASIVFDLCVDRAWLMRRSCLMFIHFGNSSPGLAMLAGTRAQFCLVVMNLTKRSKPSSCPGVAPCQQFLSEGRTEWTRFMPSSLVCSISKLYHVSIIHPDNWCRRCTAFVSHKSNCIWCDAGNLIHIRAAQFAHITIQWFVLVCYLRQCDGRVHCFDMSDQYTRVLHALCWSWTYGMCSLCI